MINHKLRELRGDRTLQEIADLIGIPKGTYASIELGRRRGRPETMHKISRFYGVSIEQVFFDKNIV